MIKKTEWFKSIGEMLSQKEKKNFLKLAIISIIAAILQSLAVAVIFPFMNFLTQGGGSLQHSFISRMEVWVGISNSNQAGMFWGSMLLMLIFLGNGVATYGLWYGSKLVWGVHHRMSGDLLHNYLMRPYPYFLDHNPSELGKHVLSDVGDLVYGAFMPLITIMTRGFIAIVLFLTLMLVDTGITIAALLIIGGGYGMVFKRTRNKLKRAGKRNMELNKRRFQVVTEGFNGIKEVKLMNREQYYVENYSEHSKEMKEIQAWNDVIGKVPRHIMEVISFGGVILLTLVLIAKEGMDSQVLPLVSLFVLAGYRLMPALQDMFNALTIMSFNDEIVKRLHKDLFYIPQNSKNLKVESLDFKECIRGEDLSFHYPNSKEQAIEHTSFYIPHRSYVAFAGVSGAGKTTMVDLLLGLLMPSKGRIYIDDQVLNHDNILQWQKNFGYVPQEIYINDDTIENNIGLGVKQEELSNEKVLRASKLANLHDFIEKHLPDGYKTKVGNNGVRLSGGQKQRIGIARALYHDPEIIVLDEATSSLDGITEAAVIDALKNLKHKKTIIVIAHRMSTIKNCEQIFLMDRGRIVDQGRYDELMKRSEMFRKLASSGEGSVD